MEQEGVTFVEAVHLLADRYGVIVPEDNKNNAPGGIHSASQPFNKERLYKLNELLTSFFEKILHEKQNKAVYGYLKSRNLPLNIIQQFRLGAAHDSWDSAINFALNSGYSVEELALIGAAVKKEESGHYYDRFRNRLIFPVWDTQGRVVGFSARTIEQNPQGAKYVNTPETPLFMKGRILYALPLAKNGIKEAQHAILCEGQLDVIAMHRADFTNAVAPQGTAFTDEQGRLLKRYTDQIMIAFDADNAGIKATLRVLEILLPLGFAVRIMVIPPGNDPDSILNAEGSQGLRRIHEASFDFFDYLFQIYSTQFDRNSPQGVSKIHENILRKIALIPNSVLRASYSSKLAHYLSLPQNAVFTELNKLRKRDSFRKRGHSEKREVQHTASTDSHTIIHQVPLQIARAEEDILEIILSGSSYARTLAGELPPEMISLTPVGSAINKVLAMTINGEWDAAEETLKEDLRGNPAPVISRILASPQLPSEKDAETREMLLNEGLLTCIKTIKSYYLKNKINQVKNQIRSEIDSDKKEKLLRECMILDSDLKKLHTIKNRD
jgi:DNA primase